MPAAVDAMLMHKNTNLLNIFSKNSTQRFVLPNGMVVVFRPDASPLASVQLWVRTGSIHEGDLLGSGVSHAVEHMVFKGTRTYTCEQIADSVQALGGHMNAYTTFDHTAYHIDLPAEHWRHAADVLCEMAFEANLDPADYEREHDVILREIDMEDDDPDWQLSNALFRCAFKQHPYRYPVIGHRAIFEELSHADLLRYYRARYVPNNAVWVIAGGIPFDELKAHLEVICRQNRRPLAPVYVENEATQLTPRRELLYGNYAVVRVTAAYKIPGMTHVDAPAIDAAAHFLGCGQSAYLWRTLRNEQRCVNAIDAHAWNPGQVGLLNIQYNCEPEKYEPSTVALSKELQKSAKAYDKNALEKFILQSHLAYIESNKTVGAQAAQLGHAEVVCGDLHYPETYLKQLSVLTVERVREVLSIYLQDNGGTTISLLPQECRRASISGARAHNLQPFTTHLLDGGAKLLYQHCDRLPKVSVRCTFFGGPLFEDVHNSGVTALMATLLTRDTKKRSAQALNELLEAKGIQFGAFSGNNTFGVAIEALSDDFELAMEVMAQALTQPLFKSSTFEIEREAQVAQMRANEDDPVSCAQNALRAAFFEGHPYAKPILGTESSLGHLTVAKVREHYGRLLRSGNCVCAISGDVDVERVKRKLRAITQKLPEGTLTIPQWTLTARRQEVCVEKPHLVQSVVMFGLPGLNAYARNFQTLELVDELCSGMSSPLFKDVRERQGLVYFVNASMFAGLDTGMFYLYAGTQKEQADAVFAAYERALEHVRSKISEDELKGAKEALKSRRKFQSQTPAARAANATSNALFGRDVNESYDTVVDAVSLSEVQNLARDLFDLDRATRLTLR